MVLKGMVQDGVIVPEPGTNLANGTEVRIEVIPPNPPKKDLADVLLEWAGSAEGLPSDLALNHDHYLYGLPKKTK
jgi:hypothetical protein